MRIFSNTYLKKTIRKRLKRYEEETVGEYQGGFRSGRSTTDQIFTLQTLQNNSWDRNLPLYILFIDFKQAYDSITREKLYEALGKLRIPNKLINLVKMTLHNTSNRILVEGSFSNQFIVKKGLRQGDPLSTDLFNLVLEAIMRGSGLQTAAVLFHSKHQLIAYADDVAILTRSRQELEKTFRKFEEEARKYGLQVNEEKTKFMEMQSEGTEEKEYIKIKSTDREYNIEKVDNFEYLGVTVTSKSQEENEIDKRILKRNRAVGSLMSILKAKDVSKVRPYETIIRSAVLYACET